ncbi:MAG: hypothetical protein V3U76_13585 [Granulosicoccus sp.]
MIIRQHGQALPLGLALILFGVLGAIVLFNTGQTATDKMRLANTADAAAYSGVLWQARALNFQAYSNRAMVANQVSIAQAVSLQSWSTYSVIAAENVANVLSPIPFVNALTRGLETVASSVNRVVSPVLNAMVGVISSVNAGLSISQDAMFASSFAATPEIIQTVVVQNDPRFTAKTAYTLGGTYLNLNDWKSFTDGYDRADKDAMHERSSLINLSRDEFTINRDWKFFKPIWLYTTPLTKHQIQKEGETRLVEVEGTDGLEYEWKAKDSLEFKNTFIRIIKSDKHFNIPIGWAEAFANERGSEGGARSIERGACSTRMDYIYSGRCASWTDNSTAERFSAVNIHFGEKASRVSMPGYGGLQGFRSLSEATLAEDRPSLMLRVEVAMQAGEVVSSNTSTTDELFAAEMVAPGELLSSVSIAEVFYKRPDIDIDGIDKIEYANGYNPYWGVRLSPISAKERALALALRPGSIATVAPTNIAEIETESDDTNSLLSSESDSSVSDVGSFTTSLADIYGADVYASIDQLVTEYESFTEDDIVGLIDEELRSRVNIDNLGNVIKEELAGQLENAVANILRGVLSSSAGQQALTSVSELQAEVAPLEQEIRNELPDVEAIEDNELYQQTIEYSAEMRRIREVVALEFENILPIVIEIWDERKAALIDKISTLRSEINSTFDENERDRIRGRIVSAEEDLDSVVRDMERDLAEQLVSIINNETDLWDMPFSTAQKAVRTILRAYEGDDENITQLLWDLPTEEESDG